MYTQVIGNKGVEYYKDGVLLKEACAFIPKGMTDELLFVDGVSVGKVKDLGLKTNDEMNAEHKFVTDNMKIFLPDGGHVVLSQRPNGELIFTHLNENMVYVSGGRLPLTIFD